VLQTAARRYHSGAVKPRSLAGPITVALLAWLLLVSCGGDDDGPVTVPGQKTATPAGQTPVSFGDPNVLTGSLLRASFPNLKLNQAISAIQSSVRNGPQLSDQQLSAGVQSEVVLDLGGKDADSSVAYDIFPSAQAASAWFQRFTLGFYGNFKIHNTYAPKGSSNAKCEQFADVGSGRNTGGTQCFALDKNVVVYGESIVYDTPSGNQQDAEALLRAAVSYFESLK
jgi:hypothetical protein